MSNLAKIKVSEAINMLISKNLNLVEYIAAVNALKFIVSDQAISEVLETNANENDHLISVINQTDINRVNDILGTIIHIVSGAPNANNIGFLDEGNINMAFNVLDTIIKNYPEFVCKFIHRQIPSILAELAIILVENLENSLLYSVNGALKAIINNDDYVYANNVKFINAAIVLNPDLKKHIQQSNGIELNKKDIDDALTLLTTNEQIGKYNALLHLCMPN